LACAAIPGRWVHAIDLRVGDILFTRDGRRVPVTNVSVRQGKMKVYNLQAEGLHNTASDMRVFSCLPVAARLRSVGSVHRDQG
jgi:hypothetical protein